MNAIVERAFLRQVTLGTMGASLPPYPLSSLQEIIIGREPSCQIVLDSSQYGMVSRRHVAIRPVTQLQGSSQWQVCDLNSVNGTFVNGMQLQGCQVLKSGDHIMLGQEGVEFIFEAIITTSPTPQPAAQPSPVFMATQMSSPPQSVPDGVSLTQLFPILSTGKQLTQKAYLVPGIFTVAFVVLMFAVVGEPTLFNIVLATYISSAAYYFIYRLCGKHKPWWWLLIAVISMMVILFSPLLDVFILVFRGILPGDIPSRDQSVGFFDLLIRMFFGAGLMEELLKALPIFAAYWLGRSLQSPWREKLGVWEPLDGILLGSAAALGFTLLETLGQYVPNIIQTVTPQAGEGLGQLVGLHLLIPRILGSVAGHMAYSGYFGYFIGLSALKPSRRWSILTVGYFTASALHALWNASGYINGVVLVVVGILSYAFLTAAILKARALSPSRQTNFATHFHQP